MKKGAGILFIAIHKGEPLVLMGRETKDLGSWSDSGKWSDFGGGRDGDESIEDCACREGFEETMGMFGGPKQLKDLIENKLVAKIPTEHYTSFVVNVKCQKKLENDFTEIYECIKEVHPELIQTDNVFFEKDRVRWFKLKKLQNDEYKINIREHFKPVLEQLFAQLLS